MNTKQDIQLFLENMISTSGLSGQEQPTREIVEQRWKGLTDELRISSLGSLHGLLVGNGEPPRRKVMLVAHMDAIGMIATGVVEGFIQFASLGAIDARILPGQPVIVHGNREYPGVVMQPDDLLVAERYSGKTIPIEHLWIDIGIEPGLVDYDVHPGDLISFAQPPVQLPGNIISGHSLDDRAGIAAITYCLELLQTKEHEFDVWAVATVQEESNYAGAYTSTYQIKPDIGLSIDVCVASDPSSFEDSVVSMGSGVAIGVLPDSHPYLWGCAQKIAQANDIPYQIDTFGPRHFHTATDAFAIQVTESGIATLVLGIPLRYMHTPVEMCAIEDIKRMGQLVADLICHFDNDFLERMSWDSYRENQQT